MLKSLMDHCMSQEIVVGHLRAKVEATKSKLAERKTWKVVQENKLTVSEQLWVELEKQVEVLGKVLEDKEGEIKDIK